MCLIHMTWNTWLQNLHKYFHLWKMPLPRTLQTPLGRIKEALSLRRCSVVLQLILLPVAMMLSEQSRRIKRELTSWMINEGKCSNSWTTTILLKPYRAHTPARRSCAVILGLFSLLISCLISRKHVRNFLAVALVLPAVQSQLPILTEQTSSNKPFSSFLRPHPSHFPTGSILSCAVLHLHLSSPLFFTM